MSFVADTLGRPLRDLRISVTDRCNFRCVYCMPKEVFGRDFEFLGRDKLLTFEEIERVARAFVAHGAEKVRLTGGEPLLRRDLERLVAMLAAIPGLDLTLTTNGALLAAQGAGAPGRRAAADHGQPRLARRRGLPGDERRRLPGRARARGDRRRRGGRACPVKVNMVVRRGLNEHSVLPMAREFRERGHILRLIEYMDVGSTNGWRLDDVVPAAEIVRHDRRRAAARAGRGRTTAARSPAASATGTAAARSA